MPTATKDAEIKFRTSDELKRQTRCVYARWGRPISEGFKLFLRKAVVGGGRPFVLRPDPSPVLTGRETLRPDPATGVTVLPAWMDAPEDEGLYDDLV